MYTPQELYRLSIMSNACMDGDLDTVQTLINNTKTQGHGFIYDLDMCAVIACKNGRLDIIKWFIDTHYHIELYKIIYHACKLNHFDIVEYILSIKDPSYNNFDDNFNNSCWKGTCLSANLHMAELLITRKIYVKRFDSLVFYASCGGNYDILMLILSHIDGYQLTNGKIAINGRVEYKTHIFDSCLRGACSSGSVEILKLAIDNGASDFDRAMYQACLVGNIEMMELLVDLGYDNWNFLLSKACCLNHDQGSEEINIEIIGLMVELGANDFNEGLIQACSYENTKIMKYMVKLGANNYNECLREACTYNQRNVIELLVQLGADAYNIGLTIGCEKRNMNTINLMVRKGATNLQLIKNIKDFKLSCYYSIYTGVEPQQNIVCKLLLLKYPVYALLIRSVLSRSIYKGKEPGYLCACIGDRQKSAQDRNGKDNHIKKLPNEIFRLLHKYF